MLMGVVMFMELATGLAAAPILLTSYTFTTLCTLGVGVRSRGLSYDGNSGCNMAPPTRTRFVSRQPGADHHWRHPLLWWRSCLDPAGQGSQQCGPCMFVLTSHVPPRGRLPYGFTRTAWHTNTRPAHRMSKHAASRPQIPVKYLACNSRNHTCLSHQAMTSN